MSLSTVNLPYFDLIFAHWDEELTQSLFGNHVHWGYWENPNWAEINPQDFVIATEKLAQKVYQTAHIKSGDSVLDVGCGFGGTISSINNHFNEVKLTGLNIDERQLDIARNKVKPQFGNSIEFSQGDATKMPFPDNSFDVVLAVECIFHFPSREKFFQEAIRVLKPNGRIALSDFVPSSILNFYSLLSLGLIDDSSEKIWGKTQTITITEYQKLAAILNLNKFDIKDITFNTLPTYSFLKQLSFFAKNKNANKINSIMEWTTRMGLLNYLILSTKIAEKR